MKYFKKTLVFSAIFLCGGYLASMFFLQIHSSFEDRLFDRIATRSVAQYSESDLSSANIHLQNLIKKNKVKNLTDIEKLNKLNELTHILLGPPRKLLFLPNSDKEKGIVDKYLHSSMISLLGGYACYMHSQVFGRFAQELGFEYRNFSMWNKGKNHNVAEVKVDGKWIVFDPLFNQVFKNDSGDIVGKKVIADNWDKYSKQVGNAVLFDRSDYVYDIEYNFTNPHRKDSPFSYIKTGVLFIWSSVLGYDSTDSLKNYMLVNRYFYWQILISIVFVCLIVVFLVSYVAIRKLEK